MLCTYLRRFLWVCTPLPSRKNLNLNTCHNQCKWFQCGPIENKFQQQWLGNPRRTSYIFGKSFSVSFLVLNGGQYLQRKDKKFRNSVNFAGLESENTNNRCGEMTSRWRSLWAKWQHRWVLLISEKLNEWWKCLTMKNECFSHVKCHDTHPRKWAHQKIMKKDCDSCTDLLDSF